LGVTGGWAYPVSEDLERQGGPSAGLEASVEFSPALRMWMGATYSNTRLVTDRMDEAIGIPPVAPPSDDFIFLEAEAPQPALEYGIGMQYLFNTSHKFKPFLGVGYGAVSLLPYEVVYDFENKPLGIEWSFEKNVEQSEFLTNLLLLRAGFEYEISKNWNWHLRATYRTGFEKTGFQSPDMLGIQAGLMRRF
ncbi:MAG TPA: outer membrane beta-barrel protein, partial [Saprospiraceae bacterium]|nr:outer membrane beta-barrel protein [Saprospiraceae bacterium]